MRLLPRMILFSVRMRVTFFVQMRPAVTKRESEQGNTAGGTEGRLTWTHEDMVYDDVTGASTVVGVSAAECA